VALYAAFHFRESSFISRASTEHSRFPRFFLCKLLNRQIRNKNRIPDNKRRKHPMNLLDVLVILPILMHVFSRRTRKQME